MAIILILTIIFIIGFCIYKNHESLAIKEYPLYYRDVWIRYQLPGKSEELIKMAWLAVNDNGEYIWTRSDNKQIIPDDWVTRWEYIK